jgi:hypothetical protein
MKTELTQARLRELLHYEPSTGELRWMLSIGGVKAGAIAGSTDSQGYVRVRLDGRTYKAHRLAWLWVHGELPEHEIDHINGGKADNRIANLRDVRHQTNTENLRLPRVTNKSGLLGVRPKAGRWHASIRLNQVAHHLGSFQTKEAAHAAYLAAKRKYHEGCTI